MTIVTINFIWDDPITLVAITTGFFLGMFWLKDRLGNTHLYPEEDIKSIIVEKN